jgi:hypothetical protein
MRFDSGLESFIGNRFGESFHVSIYLPELELRILGEGLETLDRIPLYGQTETEAFGLLKSTLAARDIETGRLSTKLHYELPGHPLYARDSFIRNPGALIRETINMRHNAEIVLNAVVSDFINPEPLRVWPHHFDTGTLIKIQENAEGSMSKSVGLGWAIPDSTVPEPYYYLNYWSEDEVKDFGFLPEHPYGDWVEEGWKGAVLKHSDILRTEDAKAQEKMVCRFYKWGIRILFEQFNLPE